MSRALNAIGYWIESIIDETLFPPQAFVGDLDPSVRRAIADYLDHGKVFEVFRGDSWCRFLCGHPGSNLELTDGRWVWPGDLSHAVRDHGVVLPDEFMRHALERGSSCSVESERLVESERSAKFDGVQPDDSFWIAWCKAHCADEVLQTLRQARETSLREAERRFEAGAAKLETDSGTSETTCQRAGCGRKAITGKRLCAWCVLNGRRRDDLEFHYSSLLSYLESMGVFAAESRRRG